MFPVFWGRFRRRQRGRVVRAPDLQFGGPRVQAPLCPVAGFVHGIPEFKSSAMPVNSSQLVCLRPVGILNPFKFNFDYLFQVFPRPH